VSKAKEFINIIMESLLSLEDLEKLKKKSRNWYVDKQQYIDQIEAGISLARKEGVLPTDWKDKESVKKFQDSGVILHRWQRLLDNH